MIHKIIFEVTAVPLLKIVLDFPDEMVAELNAAASNSHLSPKQFSEQLIQAELATRRLERLPSPADKITMPRLPGRATDEAT